MEQSSDITGYYNSQHKLVMNILYNHAMPKLNTLMWPVHPKNQRM